MPDDAGKLGIPWSTTAEVAAIFGDREKEKVRGNLKYFGSTPKESFTWCFSWISLGALQNSTWTDPHQRPLPKGGHSGALCPGAAGERLPLLAGQVILR